MKIKIIDLFNKIYNQEDVPRKIILDNHIWEYLSEYNDYKNEYKSYLFGYYIANYDDVYDFLSKKVEIIEEDKNIEKLNDKARYYFSTIANGMTKRDREALDEMFEKCYKTIDELIDEVNKLKENR